MSCKASPHAIRILHVLCILESDNQHWEHNFILAARWFPKSNVIISFGVIYQNTKQLLTKHNHNIDISVQPKSVDASTFQH